jgi:hypothetical protein
VIRLQCLVRYYEDKLENHRASVNVDKIIIAVIRDKTKDGSGYIRTRTFIHDKGDYEGPKKISRKREKGSHR